jgi:hypothetical protein
MTITRTAPKRKSARAVATRRAPTRAARRVASLTLAEFRAMMDDIIDQRLAALTDPDAGLELRPEIAQGLARQEREFAAGKRGKPLAEVARRLGLD